MFSCSKTCFYFYVTTLFFQLYGDCFYLTIMSTLLFKISHGFAHTFIRDAAFIPITASVFRKKSYGHKKIETFLSLLLFTALSFSIFSCFKYKFSHSLFPNSFYTFISSAAKIIDWRCYHSKKATMTAANTLPKAKLAPVVALLKPWALV